MELSNSGPMRIKPGLRPQHIYSSVLEKASRASESHPPAVPLSVGECISNKGVAVWEVRSVTEGAEKGSHTNRAIPWKQEGGGLWGRSDGEPELWVLASGGGHCFGTGPLLVPSASVCVVGGS